MVDRHTHGRSKDCSKDSALRGRSGGTGAQVTTFDYTTLSLLRLDFANFTRFFWFTSIGARRYEHAVFYILSGWLISLCGYVFCDFCGCVASL